MLADYYISLAHSAIGDDNFAGDDARYSPEFESLENELEKAAGLHLNGGPDWKKVLELAEALLRHQTKDLRVACWLTWSLYQCEQLPGLHAGLAMLEQLCTQHWDDLHPRKQRTRSAALGWLAPRLDQALGEHKPGAEQLQLIEQMCQSLTSLDQALSAQLGDDAPHLQPLCRRLQALLKQPAGDSATPSTTATANPASISPPPSLVGTAAPELIISTRDAHKALRSLQEQARPLCQWWQNQTPGDPRAIRLSRTLLWLPLDNLPDHDAAGKTALRGLPNDRLAAFQERINQGQHSSLLPELETSLARAPFWLDGQYLLWQCLNALKAEQAMQELEQQLAQLLRRLPGLEALSFFDGTPFANNETRAWLSSLGSNRSAKPNTATSHHDGNQAEWEQGYQQAQQILAQDGLRGAAEHLADGLQRARGGRARLHWQLARARLCFEARKYDLAKTQLESLDHVLRGSALEDWEPDLVITVLRLLHNCYELMPQNAAVRERRDGIYRRLCHLDFETVLDQALGP